jgi:hypothetical protein
MVTSAIYDQGYGGSTINMQGTVSISYVNARRRHLQGSVEEAEEDIKPFALSVAVQWATRKITVCRDPSKLISCK